MTLLDEIVSLLPILLNTIIIFGSIFLGWYLNKITSDKQFEYQKIKDAKEIKEKLYRDLMQVNKLFFDTLTTWNKKEIIPAQSEEYLANFTQFNFLYRILIERIILHIDLSNQEKNKLNQFIEELGKFMTYISTTKQSETNYEELQNKISPILDSFYVLIDFIST